MEEKIDYLFLEKDCPYCASIRAELDMDAVTKDEFRGKDGQKFFVFSALSNEASTCLLNSFGLGGHSMPVLLTHTGEERTKEKHIIGYLRVQNMTD